MKININIIKLFKKHISPLDWKILCKYRAIKKYCNDYCKYYKINNYEELKTELNKLTYIITIKNGFIWSKTDNADYYVKLNKEVSMLNHNK